MAEITRLNHFVAGINRGVDLASNTLVVLELKVGGAGGSGTLLTKTIVDRLVALQNGTNVDATYHVHNDTTIPYTRGDGSKKDIQAASDDVGSAINDLDDDKISKTGSIAFTGNQPMGSHKLTGLSAGSGAGDSVRYEQAILTSGANAFAADQSMGSHKLTSLTAGSTSTDAVNYGQVILKDGTNAFTADQSFGGHKATNVSDPTSAQDAATKAYVDAVAMGLKPKAAVRAASTANVNISTGLENGDTLDGVTLATGDRVLLKDQTAAETNGIYIVSVSGAASRATDFDSLTPIDEINGAWVAVQEGTANAGHVYVEVGTVATLNTDPIAFTYWDPIASLVGGDMITKSGNNLSVDLASSSGLESSNPGNSAGQLRVKLEASNPSLKFTGSNELAVKLDAAGAITSGASGLIVGVDGTTIEISSDALRVKDLGISTAKIAADAVTDAKIRLTNNNYLRARNAAGSGDVNILKVNASDVIEFASFPQKSGSPANADDLVNKSYVDGAIGTSGVLTRTVVAGEAFAANTTFTVRWAKSGETAGRVYKADYDATSADNFHVIGFVKVGGSSLSAGNNATLYTFGPMTQGSSDTAFNAGDIGLPVYLTASGAYSITVPSTAAQALVIVGYVQTTTIIDVKSVQIVGVL